MHCARHRERASSSADPAYGQPGASVFEQGSVFGSFVVWGLVAFDAWEGRAVVIVGVAICAQGWYLEVVRRLGGYVWHVRRVRHSPSSST